jgi:hypothetical protein
MFNANVHFFPLILSRFDKVNAWVYNPTAPVVLLVYHIA